MYKISFIFIFLFSSLFSLHAEWEVLIDQKEVTKPVIKKSVKSKKIVKKNTSDNKFKDENTLLRKEIDTLKSKIFLLENEIESLNSTIEVRKHTAVNAIIGKDKKRASHNFNLNTASNFKTQKPEVKIATITVDKANLRSGPSKVHSPLMTISKGSRLVIETRIGDWYRVIAPNGSRAWANSSVISISN